MDELEPLHTAEEPPWQEIMPEDLGLLLRPDRPGNRARLWALTLDSRSIPCQLDRDHGGWHLLTSPDAYRTAVNELRRFEELNRDWPPQPPPPRPLVENTLATLSILILLASFHNLSHLAPGAFATPMPDWLELGSAKTALIVGGEWWRLITSLTLHSDVAHLASNLAIGGVFVFLLCRELGSGLAWSLILLSGALGNLCNAWVQPAAHNSVGASTAVFGTVGILAALSQVRYRTWLRRRWPLPVAASMALLAVLGSEGKNTDVGAHLFGLLCGIVIGIVTEWIIDRRGHPGALLNALLALLAGLVTMSAWWLAVIKW